MSRTAIIRWIFEPYEAQLIDTIPAGVRPDAELVRRYYGHPPKIAYKAAPYVRYVFVKQSGAHVVVPDIPENQPFWRWKDGP